MDDVVSLLELPFSLSSFDEGTGLNFHTWSFVDFVLSDNISNFIFCRPHKSLSRVQEQQQKAGISHLGNFIVCPSINLPELKFTSYVLSNSQSKHTLSPPTERHAKLKHPLMHIAVVISSFAIVFLELISWRITKPQCIECR